MAASPTRAKPLALVIKKIPQLTIAFRLPCGRNLDSVAAPPHSGLPPGSLRSLRIDLASILIDLIGLHCRANGVNYGAESGPQVNLT